MFCDTALVCVCAEFRGDLPEAKVLYANAFKGIYLIREYHDSDITAARWLGDVCLQLHEFDNTVPAWSIALEASLRHYVFTHDRTRLAAQEILKPGKEYSFLNISTTIVI